MSTTEVLQISAEEAVKGFQTLATSIRGMYDLEQRIAALQAVSRRIAAPILKQAREQTAELRIEAKAINAKIVEKEKPYREQAATKTKDLREEIAAKKAELSGVKAAIMQAVNPVPASSTQSSQS
jgi:hypothetical protein